MRAHNDADANTYPKNMIGAGKEVSLAWQPTLSHPHDGLVCLRCCMVKRRTSALVLGVNLSPSELQLYDVCDDRRVLPNGMLECQIPNTSAHTELQVSFSRHLRWRWARITNRCMQVHPAAKSSLYYSYEELTRLAETRLAQNSLNYIHIAKLPKT